VNFIAAKIDVMQVLSFDFYGSDAKKYEPETSDIFKR